jgi:PAS domain S-box-containing protein
MHEQSKDIPSGALPVISTNDDLRMDVTGPVLVMDISGRILNAESAFTDEIYTGSGKNIGIDQSKRKLMAEEALRMRKPVSLSVVQDKTVLTYAIQPIRSFDESISHFLLTVQEAKKTDKPERKKENSLDAVISLYDAIPASILIIDPHEHLMGWNRFSRERINNRHESEMLGINPMDRVHPEDLPGLLKKGHNVLDHDVEETAEFRMYHGDGPPYKWATMRAKRAVIDGQPFVVAVVTEITELKEAEEKQEKLQEQLLQYQKLELIGQLAGGIAHDFNNALAAIIGNTELVLNKLGPSSPFIGNIKDINTLANRSAKLTRQLLAFARKQMTLPKVVDLNEAITECLPLHRRLIGENIQFDWSPCSTQAFVLLDPTQLEQILSNLFVNAHDAIDEKGRIFITCDFAHFDNEDCIDSRSGFSPGDYVRLSIGDTGSGIDAKILPHIYEPFFTTKEVGKGTGLGLSTVYGIVMQNNGFIECRTEFGKGTTFDIYLPKFRESEEGSESEIRMHTLLNAKQTILVVEDEPYILKLVKDILESRGFTVFAAKDAEESIDITRICATQIDLLITDVVLPAMNGVELSSLLQKKNPALRVLFMSAHSPENIKLEKQFEDGVDFIQKPFSINDFIKIINRVLTAP